MQLLHAIAFPEREGVVVGRHCNAAGDVVVQRLLHEAFGAYDRATQEYDLVLLSTHLAFALSLRKTERDETEWSERYTHHQH